MISEYTIRIKHKPKLTEEELMIGELARLQTLMMLYENKEEYEKAAVLLKKVNNIKNKLK